MFQPAIPMGGYGGWLLLEKTSARQQELFEKSPGLQREIDYFLENIEKATTVEALVSDRRLLAVALGAFGLDDEIDKRALIRQILEGSTEDASSLVNRMSEPRYKELAKAFGYGDASGGFNIQLDSFKDKIVSQYKQIKFEYAVGDVDDDMRLAMNFRREIKKIAAAENADRTGWFQVMGQRPLSIVLSKALGLPDSMATLDVDRQREIFENKARALFGDASVAQFKDDEAVDALIRRFFLMRQVDSGPSAMTPGYAALTLLQAAPVSGAGAQNLFMSLIP